MRRKQNQIVRKKCHTNSRENINVNINFKNTILSVYGVSKNANVN